MGSMETHLIMEIEPCLNIIIFDVKCVLHSITHAYDIYLDKELASHDT